MGKRGRPTKEPTAEEKAKVAELVEKKQPQADIARILGMTVPTFRKYFHEEFFSGKKNTAPVLPSRPITDAQREKVKLYLGYGMSPEDIALALDYTRDGEFESFCGDFAIELRIGKAVTRAETIERLVNQSKGGLIGATTKLEALSRPVVPSDGAAPSGSAYVGKKEAAKADAASAVAGTSKFAPRSAPRLATSGGRTVDAP